MGKIVPEKHLTQVGVSTVVDSSPGIIVTMVFVSEVALMYHPFRHSYQLNSE